METAIQESRPALGEGIFTIKDASNILSLPNGRLSGLLKNFWDGRFSESSHQKYSWGSGKEKSMNFHTLIEVYTFFQLRNFGVSVRNVAKAHEFLSKHLNTPYPFAMAEILVDDRKVLFKDTGILVGADIKLQTKIEKVIEPFCKKIQFGSDSLAEKFYPKGKNIEVVIDPRHQFGQPTIDNSNILAETIYRMYLANEKPEFIAEIYELSVKEVKDAIFFFNKDSNENLY